MYRTMYLATGLGMIDPDLIEKIGNLGIMLVISSVIVLFIIKVLSVLLQQNEQTISSILPRINAVVDLISEIKRDLTEVISTHNLNSNKQFFEASTKLNSIQTQIENMDDRMRLAESNTADIVAQLKFLTYAVDAITPADISAKLGQREVGTKTFRQLEEEKKAEKAEKDEKGEES